MNKHSRFRFLSFLLIGTGILFQSCSTEENTAWDIDVLGPLAETHLSVADIVADSLIISEPGAPVVIRYVSKYNLIPNDSLYQIPDTAFNNSFSLPLTVNLPAGFQVLNLSQLIKFAYKDAQLTEAVIESGTATFEVQSMLGDKVYFNYSIPKAFKNGIPLNLYDEEIQAGSEQSPATVQKTIDLSGYYLDLRGDNGTLANQLKVNLDAKLNPTGTGAAAIANQALFNYTNKFIAIRPYYARGYLGSSSFTGSDYLNLSDMRKLSGILRLQDIHLDLDIENSIGADFSLTINNIIASRGGVDLALNHSLIGSNQQLSRAQHIVSGDLPYTPTYKHYSFTTSNSNLKDLIELLPQQFSFTAKANLNPLGNVSSGNDFFYSSSNLRVTSTLEMPLSFSANALYFNDTLTTKGIEATKTENVISGALRIMASNSFPFDLQVKGYLLDENKVLIDSLLSTQTIAAGIANAELHVEQPTITQLNIPVSESLRLHLDQARFIVLRARLNTLPENTFVPLYTDYELRLQLIGDGKYRVKLK